MIKVYIILVNYKGWRDTQECLESLLKLNYPNFQILVVDNDSPNKSLEHLLAWARGEESASQGNASLAHLSMPAFPKPVSYMVYGESGFEEDCSSDVNSTAMPIIFIKSDRNGGFAYGNNVGIKFALLKGDADYIWLLNNDTVVESNALSDLVQRAEAYKVEGKKIGIIGAKLMYYHAPEVIQGVGGIYNKWLATTKHIGINERDVGQYDSDHISQAMSYPIGASMFVDKSFVSDVGLMCEEYFLFFEEMDWVSRGRLKGWNLGYCWASRIYHKEGGSIGSGPSSSKKSTIAEYYALKNRLLFSSKFNPSAALVVRFSFLLVAINRIIRLDFKSIPGVISIMLGRV